MSDTMHEWRLDYGHLIKIVSTILHIVHNTTRNRGETGIMILKSDDVLLNNIFFLANCSISCLDCVDNKQIYLLIEGYLHYYFRKCLVPRFL